MTESLSRRSLGKASLTAAIGSLAAGVATRGDVAQAYVETPLTGPTNMSPAVERAWRDYLDALEACRQFIYTREFSERPQIRAEANEFLMQVQAAAYSWIMAPRVDYPRFFDNTLTEPMVGTWYLTCPDFRYRSAFIDGAQTYRIWGKRSNSRFLDIQLGPSTGAEPDDEYNKLPTVPYPVDTMHLEPDGSFEIIASPHPHEGNWIQLDDRQDRMTLLSREGFYDWANETPSLLRIERVSSSPPRPIQWGEDEVIAHIEQSARFVNYVVKTFSSAIFDLVLKSTDGKMNTFAEMHLPSNAGQNHAANYSFMIYDVGPDEAVIVEGEVPTSKYWGIQLCDRYIRTTDFTYHQSSLNGHQVRIDSDGKFRMIISPKDPGAPNWLDPVDIVPLGMVYYRQYFQATPAGLPTVQKVSLDELRRNLPLDTPSVSPAERARQLRDRAWAMLALYGY